MPSTRWLPSGRWIHYIWRLDKTILVAKSSRDMGSDLDPPPASSADGVRTLPSMSTDDLTEGMGESLPKVKSTGLAIDCSNPLESVPMPQCEAVQQAHKIPLESLRADCDTMVARMNTPPAKRGVVSLFVASTSALSKSAVRAAQRRPAKKTRRR